MGSKRNRNKHKYRHISDADARKIARSLPNPGEGTCYMCFHSFQAGEQVTTIDLKGVNGIGVVQFCTPCAHELKASFEAKGVKVPWLGESLHDEQHEVSYDGKDLIYRG